MKKFINLIVAVLLLLPQGVAALCVQGDCINGQGTVVLPDGRRYVGEFQDGIRTGRGLMTFPDGTKYLGDWQNDKPHGHGTLSSVGKFEYAGEFAKGVRQGQGTLETVDGKKYSGQWQNDVPHGRGKITYPDGAVFVGQFDNGKRNGQGEAIYSDGTKYTGQWQDDLPNGHGTKIYVDGVAYTGEFRNGLMHGQGTIVNPDGSSYSGLWQNEVLVKKEEVVGETEVATAEETEGHVPAVVDEAPGAAPVDVGVNEAAVEVPPSVPTGDIANTRAGYASVNQNGVFVRSGPSTEYRIVRAVSQGFPVQVIGQQDNWSNIKDFVGQEGWIYLPFLGRNNSVIVKVKRVNIRSGPGLGFTVLGQVEFGTVLQVNNIKGDWYLVAMPDGMEGWLYRKLLWPAGQGIVPARDVPGAVAQGPKEDMQPVGVVTPAIGGKSVEEAGMTVQVETPEAGSEPVADMPETEVERTAAPAVASVKDEALGTVPAQSIAQPGTEPVGEIIKTAYAAVAQNGKGANIRSAPLFAADVLRSVPPGFPLAVIERQGKWVLVEDFRERRGWVYAPLLTDLQTVIIKVRKANLRRGPSLIDEIVAQLDYGAIMFIDETRGDWLKVSNPEGPVGWLHRIIVWP
jgi:SH3-like domain-containing protein